MKKQFTQNTIDDFLQAKKIAIVGASHDEKKFGHQIFKHLLDNNYNVVPVNPNSDKIAEIECMKSINELPDDVDAIFVVTPKEQTDAIVQETIDKGIKKIWIQQMSETPESIALAIKNNIPVIHNECIFMFANPSGIHSFHRWLKKIVGALPKKN